MTLSSTPDKGGTELNQSKEYPSLSHITDQEAEALCQELRSRVIQVVSNTGGHLASNLGVVELTVAIHRVYDTSRDRLVFDVGHQCYVHKMLTGRNGRMETLRSFGGIAGFPKPAESQHDACIAGHASAAVSTALGMAIARTRLGEDYRVVALLGDGSLTGGLAYEGLSMAGQSGEPMVVILNDNGMSINASMGGIAQHLAKQRLKPQYLWAKEIYRKIMRATPPGRVIHQGIHTIKAAIMAGELAEGDPLPSIRALANDLRISVITTKRAYAELEEAGFIDTVQGKGSFVAGGNLELLREERLRQVEGHLARAVAEAENAGIEAADLHAMLDVLLEEN